MKTKKPSRIELECLNNASKSLGIQEEYSVRKNIISELNKAKRSRNGERVVISDEQRNRIHKRDGYRCVLCGNSHNLCLHHRKKVSEGGTNDDDNLVTLCYPCHAKQHPEIANLILSQWYDILLKENI